MANVNTTIAWTDATWSPVTGCTKVSQGCKHCYAERIFHRPYPGRVFTDVRCHPERLDAPLHWRKPRRVFVNSMSDLFHEAMSWEFLDAVFGAMAVTQRHTYQILTKRPRRMREYLTRLERDCEDHPIRFPGRISRRAAEFLGRGSDNCGPQWPLPNVWLGVSVEDQATADERIPILLDTPAAVRFVSAEPLLGPVNLNWIPVEGGHISALAGARPAYVPLDWVPVGGESGPKARPCNVAWIRAILAQCHDAGTACFVKQLGANTIGWCYGNLGDEFDADCQSDEGHEGYCPAGYCACRTHRAGADPAEWPEDLRVREFPKENAP